MSNLLRESFDVKTIFGQLEQQGYAIIENALEKGVVESAKLFVSQVASTQRGAFSVVGHENFKNSVLGDLYRDDLFLELLKELTEMKLKTVIENNCDMYQVMRVLQGESLNSQSYLFHFDNYTLTAALPIVIPNSNTGENGDLYILPNVRNVSGNPNMDAFIKLLTQNPLVRKLLSYTYIRNKLGFIRLPLQPGNLYLFWGFCTYHGNGDCEPGNTRATALYHYHKPIQAKGFLNSLIKTKKRSRVALSNEGV